MFCPDISAHCIQCKAIVYRRSHGCWCVCCHRSLPTHHIYKPGFGDHALLECLLEQWLYETHKRLVLLLDPTATSLHVIEVPAAWPKMCHHCIVWSVYCRICICGVPHYWYSTRQMFPTDQSRISNSCAIENKEVTISTRRCSEMPRAELGWKIGLAIYAQTVSPQLAITTDLCAPLKYATM